MSIGKVPIASIASSSKWRRGHVCGVSSFHQRSAPESARRGFARTGFLHTSG
jgi:hypothetical protein